MNRMDNNLPSSRGVVLTDNVDFNWLMSLVPKYNHGFVKFVVNVETNRVAVGMDMHRDAEVLLSDSGIDNLYGGNIFEDGSIVYESTLNSDKNVRSKWFKKHPGNPRLITDPEIINMINSVLFGWIERW